MVDPYRTHSQHLYSLHRVSSQKSIAGKLAEFSLNRRVSVIVLLMSIFVIGMIATQGIPRELFPRGYESKFLRVYVPWRNAPAEEVLEKITLPLEEELSTVKDLVHVNSYSSQRSATVFLSFKQNVDIDVAYREVRDRVERARLRFPDDVEQVFIQKDDPDSMPVAVLGMAIDPSVTDFYNLIEKKVVQPLKRLDGVANVQTDGIIEKEVIIEVDKERADAHGLNIYEMAQDLGADNFTLASGNVRQAGKKYLLRSVATYETMNEIENRPVNDSLRLKDIARVKYEEPEKNFAVRVNGNPAVAIVIFKEGDANTVDICAKLAEEVKRMQADPIFSSVMMEMFFDQGRIVQSSITNLVTGGEIGGVLAALVLFVFLRRFRLTLIVSASIPLSLLISLTVMYFSGESLNMITILGLVICVGLLVDNSVVVAENIHRHVQEGMERRAACIHGAREIALAITMATLTTVIVFLPVALVEGQAQFFLMRLALPISVSLLASLVVALVFIPISVYVTLGRNPSHQPASDAETGNGTPNGSIFSRIVNRIYDHTVEPLARAYQNVLAFFLRRRMDLVMLIIALFTLTFTVIWEQIDIVPNQEEDRTSFRIGVEMPRNSNFKDAARYFADAERVLKEVKEELNLKGFMFVHFARGGRLEGWLEPDQEYSMTATEMADYVMDLLPQPPGVKLETGRESQVEEAKGKSVYVVRLEGEDANQLNELAEELEPRFLEIPGVIGARSGNERPPNELALVVDRDRANASQVNPEFISGVVGYALRGRALPRFHYEGREIPVKVRFPEEDRQSLSKLANFQVPTQTGESLPLSALTDVKMLQVSSGIFRTDKKTAHTMTLDLKEDMAREARERISAVKKSIDLPEGVSFGSYRGDEAMGDDVKNLQFAALMSVVFIYLLMGFLFESFILPLSIIITIPLASIGVVWIHFITGKDLDMLGFVGAILLIGVVVNNGIVLVDYVNQLRHRGMERAEALKKAAERRFRPIVMTAITTVIGMVPLTISKPNEMGLSYKSFGLTLIGGMTTATILTLLVIPLFYTFFDDLRGFLSNFAARFFQSADAPVGPRAEALTESQS